MSLTAVMGIASAVPGLLRLFKGDKAADIADKAIDVAKYVTGDTDVNAAIHNINSDPGFMAQFQIAMQPIVIAELEAQTAQLESINATMRAEYSQDDLYTKRWRPTYGYCAAVTWVVQMLGLMIILGWAVIANPTEAPNIIAAITGMLSPMMVLWSVALAVLGISISKRSDDKAVKLGHEPPAGILHALASRIGGNNDRER